MMLKRTCPKCGKEYTEHPALSRTDNKTEICPECGVREALEDWKNWKEMNVSEQGET